MDIDTPADWEKYESLVYSGLDMVMPMGNVRRPMPQTVELIICDFDGVITDNRVWVDKGKPASWSVCLVWDYHHAENLLFLVAAWRDRVGWNDLKRAISDTLREYRVNKCYIENAHHGPALREELGGVAVEMIGPVIDGMTESHRGAKLERAIASGLLSRIEDHRLLTPADDRRWIGTYRAELTAWGGLPDETADQIDCSSYACYVTRRMVSSWGGFVKTGGLKR